MGYCQENILNIYKEWFERNCQTEEGYFSVICALLNAFVLLYDSYRNFIMAGSLRLICLPDILKFCIK